MAIRIVLADDHSLLRKGLVGLFRTVADIEVVAEAADGNDALRVIQKHKPDVALLDVRMPSLSGVDVLLALAKKNIVQPAILLTTFDDDLVLLEGARAGVKGFLLKDVSFEQLVETIRGVNAGESFLGPALSPRMLKALQGYAASSVVPPGETLTPRETEVLQLMARGFSNLEISSVLGLSLGTVKNHGSNAFSKLGARDRTQAVLKALDLGWLTPP